MRRGVERRERMNRDSGIKGSGIKDRDERSRGMEIHIAEAVSKIKLTEPLGLAKHAVRRNRNRSDSSGSDNVRKTIGSE